MMFEDFRLEPSASRLEVEGYCFEVRVLDCEPCVLVDAVAVFCGFANPRSMLRMLRRNTEGFGSADCPRVSGVQYIPLNVLAKGLRRSHSRNARLLAYAAETYAQKGGLEPTTSRLKIQIAELENEIRQIESEIDRLDSEIVKREAQISELATEITKRETKVLDFQTKVY